MPFLPKHISILQNCQLKGNCTFVPTIRKQEVISRKI